MILTLNVPSTPQVVGYIFFTSSAAAQATCAAAEQQWWLQFHLLDYEEPPCMMAKHPGGAYM